MTQPPFVRGIRAPRASRGLSLVELMIAMTIGLIILMAVSTGYLSGLAMQRTHTDVSHLQESGRFAFELLARAARHAGYRNTYAVYPATATGGVPSEFCSTGALGSQILAVNDPATIDPGSATLTGATVTILNRSDVLRVRYFGEDNAAGTAADGSVLDCLGNAVRRGGNSSVPVEDTLYVATDSTTDPSNPQPALYCRNSTTGGNGTPLIPGVESMQILYGEDIDADGRVDRYLPYSLVSNPDNVYTVMVSLVLASPNAVATTRLARTFNHFGTDYAAGNTAPTGDTGSVYVAAADGKIRLQVSTSFGLRNFRQC